MPVKTKGIIEHTNTLTTIHHSRNETLNNLSEKHTITSNIHNLTDENKKEITTIIENNNNNTKEHIDQLQSMLKDLETHTGEISNIHNRIIAELKIQQSHQESFVDQVTMAIENTNNNYIEILERVQQEHVENIQTIHNIYIQTGVIGVIILVGLIGIGGFFLMRRLDAVQNVTPIITTPQLIQIIQGNNLLKNSLIKSSLGIGLGLGALLFSIFKR